ncbi:hypothetical protein BDN67DRAFT_278113 [Paxillus ammoniavirescens]|nr:hypothetical protein BDN67DRAFT_278113 [Paxillus ammoniavirescens]
MTVHQRRNRAKVGLFLGSGLVARAGVVLASHPLLCPSYRSMEQTRSEPNTGFTCSGDSHPRVEINFMEYWPKIMCFSMATVFTRCVKSLQGISHVHNEVSIQQVDRIALPDSDYAS